MISDQQMKNAREYCEREKIDITDEQLQSLADVLMKPTPGKPVPFSGASGSSTRIPPSLTRQLRGGRR
jgi:hypothetical protein